MKLDFAVIGAQKAGSTFLADLLAGRPDVYLPRDECPHLEDPDYGAGGVAELEAALAGRTEPVVGIKRPNYLGRAEVPSRFAAHFPDAGALVVLRDPVARFVSAYFHAVRYGFLPMEEPATGMTKVLDGAYDRPRAAELLEFGRYAELLERWDRAIGPERLHVVLFEDLVASPGAALADVARFLGITRHAHGALPRVRMAAVKHPVRLRYWQRTNPIVFEYFAGGERQRVRRPRLAKVVHGVDSVVLARVFPDDRVPRPPGALLERVAAYYRSDIQALGRRLGRDLSSWGTR